MCSAETTRRWRGAWYPSCESQVSSTQVKILVPGNHLMVGLLGQRDELLRTVEEAFGGTRIHVRGNEITVEDPRRNESGACSKSSSHCSSGAIGSIPPMSGDTIEMVKEDVRPSEVLTAEVAARAGPQGAPEDRRPKALRRRHHGQHDHLRHRACRHRQVVPRGRARRAGAPGQGGRPHHPHPPSGRGR